MRKYEVPNEPSAWIAAALAFTGTVILLTAYWFFAY